MPVEVIAKLWWRSLACLLPLYSFKVQLRTTIVARPQFFSNRYQATVKCGATGETNWSRLWHLKLSYLPQT